MIILERHYRAVRDRIMMLSGMLVCACVAAYFVRNPTQFTPGGMLGMVFGWTVFYGWSIAAYWFFTLRSPRRQAARHAHGYQPIVSAVAFGVAPTVLLVGIESGMEQRFERVGRDGVVLLLAASALGTLLCLSIARSYAVAAELPYCCEACGYDLRGLPDGARVCPECGEAVPAERTMRRARAQADEP